MAAIKAERRTVADQANARPLEAMRHYFRVQPDGTPYCVAFSGGLDSTVLLHLAVVALKGDAHDSEAGLLPGPLRAIHIDHGLQPGSHRWARHCTAVAEALQVPLSVERVDVSVGGDGPEAQARLVRYAAFARHLLPGEHLLMAQHADDLAETFLLQALRGAGPDGLASIPARRAFGGGVLARPLLGCAQAQLQDLAQRWCLGWIEDESNADLSVDRNYLRHEILPRLRDRWPSAAFTLGRAAHRSAAASQTLVSLAAQDLALVRVGSHRTHTSSPTSALSVAGLRLLGRERLYNCLRLWVREQGFRMPRLQDLVQVRTDLIAARPDAQPLVNVREYQFRRYRDRLYVMRPPQPVASFVYRWERPFEELHIVETGQVLERGQLIAQGMRLPESKPIMVRSREGGELIELGDPAFHKSVKKLLQEAAVPPWRRRAIPLLFVGDELVAVWGVAVARSCQAAHAGAHRPVRQISTATADQPTGTAPAQESGSSPDQDPVIELTEERPPLEGSSPE